MPAKKLFSQPPSGAGVQDPEDTCHLLSSRGNLPGIRRKERLAVPQRADILLALVPFWRQHETVSHRHD